MRAALALTLLVAASCGSDDPGLRLEILAGDTGAVKIELYLGTRPCEGCDGKLAPKGVTAKLAGEVWYLDGSAAAGTPNTAAELDGGRYVYDLRTPAPDKDARLAHVLVVGYDAQKKLVASAELTDVPVYHAATEWYRITLSPAMEATSSDRPTPAGDRVYVWRRTDPNLAACVGYEHASDTGVKRLWFVPEDDTDCDQVATAECDKYAYKASGKADLGNANCVTSQFPVPGTTGKTCLLGGPACIDGADANTSCGPVGPSYCLPDAICANATCAQNLGMCLRDGQTSPVPRVRCDIPFNQAQGGVPCAGAQQRHAEIDLSPLVSSPSNPGTALTTCKSLLFADPMLGMVNVMNKIVSNQVEIKPDPLSPPCGFGMSWASGTASSILVSASVLRMMIVELENANRMLIPIEIAFHPSQCLTGDMMTCGVTVVPSDGITHCAQ